MDDGFYDRATLIGSSVCSPVGLNEGLVPPRPPPVTPHRKSRQITVICLQPLEVTA